MFIRVETVEVRASMNGMHHHPRARWSKDRGQITIFVVLAMALFLLGFVGFAVDMTNLWFHRQMAQGAADAACQAGVMDVLYRAKSSNVGPAGMFPLSAFDCVGTTYSPCQYASFNGYPADQAGKVLVSFPSSSSAPPDITLPDPGMAPAPLIRVDIIDTVRMYFAPLITGNTNQEVRASATCAVVLTQAPIPIIVLQPWCPHSFQMSGNPCIQVIGGPDQSIQVNSDNSSAACTTQSAGCPTGSAGVACGGGGNLSIDLSQAGPDYTGSLMGVEGGPTTFPNGFYGGSYASPYPAIEDPYHTMDNPGEPAPSPTRDPSFGGTGPLVVNRGVSGCPAPVGMTCDRYMPGLYPNPIVVQGRIAIFDPGLYYIKGDKQPVSCSDSGTGCIPKPKGNCHAALFLGSGSLARPSTEGDGTGGVQFYLSGSGGGRYGSVVVTSNSGATIGGSIPFSTDGGGGANPPALCPLNTSPPTGLSALPVQFDGSVFLGPCEDPFTGAPSPNRGVVFFQDRNNDDPNGQAALQGGGSLLIAGTMYFHHCPAAPYGACDPVNDFKSFLALGGTPGSSTRVYGNIITDQLQMSGNPLISMILDPTALFNILRATLVM